MELSGIELTYLINEINTNILSGYYVGNITGITRNSFLLKLRHSVGHDVSLMLSVKGVWLTRFKFKQGEEIDFLRIIRQHIERARIETISQYGSERIITLRFRHHDSKIAIVIVELFGIGNIILCDQRMQILAVLNPIQVRHRILRKGYEYTPPPARGTDVLELTLEQLKLMRDKTELKNLDILRWLGRNISIPKKFVEKIVERAEINVSDIGHLTDNDLARIYESILDLITNIKSGNFKAQLITDDKGKARDVLIAPIAGSERENSKERISTNSYMYAVDEVLSNDIMERLGNMQTTEFDRQMAVIEHDIEQQNKAKQEVISKSSSIRNVANRLMTAAAAEDSLRFDCSQFKESLASDSAYFVLVKGKKYLEVSGERVPVGDASFAKTSSLLFERAKELEKACNSIEEAKTKLYSQLNNLKNRANLVHGKIELSEQTSKEWYERYRWFVTTDGLLSIGGRDATSNSAIIRKYLTENDLVLHAEVFGSPFFILKGAKRAEKISDSLVEVAQATVSFSRAWKDGLSSADAYWVEPSQIKKGAPTGQFLPKGSFVVEGKRNYIKGIEINLAIGVAKNRARYLIVCGPSRAIKRRSIIFSRLAPGGLDPNSLAKKVKSELIKLTIETPSIATQNAHLLEYLKQFSLTEIARAIPSGHARTVLTEKGELEDIAVDT